MNWEHLMPNQPASTRLELVNKGYPINLSLPSVIISGFVLRTPFRWFFRIFTGNCPSKMARFPLWTKTTYCTRIHFGCISIYQLLKKRPKFVPSKNDALSLLQFWARLCLGRPFDGGLGNFFGTGGTNKSIFSNKITILLLERNMILKIGFELYNFAWLDGYHCIT